MTAPPGATIAGFWLLASLKGTRGWDAAVFDNGGFTHAVCPGGAALRGRQHDHAQLRPNSGAGYDAGDHPRALLREQLHQHRR